MRLMSHGACKQTVKVSETHCTAAYSVYVSPDLGSGGLLLTDIFTAAGRFRKVTLPNPLPTLIHYQL
jgi:hypothetical protein